MQRVLLFIFISTIAFFSFTRASIDIVYPKKNGAVINAKSTFFIGSANPKEKLFINSKEVKVAPNGAFAQLIELNKEGRNDFVLKSGSEILKFSILKPFKISCVYETPILKELEFTEYRTNSETPLRSTPIDSGINRLAMLSENTKLIINGEKGNFARVYLDKDTIAWVLKKDISLNENQNSGNIKLEKYKTKKHKNFVTYEFQLSDRAPFIIEETEKDLIFTIYNLKKLGESFKIKYSTNKLIGYDYEYKHNKLVVKIRRNNNYLKNKPVVVIDAGHGGLERGAIGCCRVPEKEINLKIAKLVEENLRTKNVKVLMTRDKDENISLKDRCKFAKKHDAQVLVSIHSNALPDGKDPLKNRGTSVYYYHPQSKSLAENILSEVTTKAKTLNDKVRQGSLALVRPTSSASVLVEVGYMINPDDYTMLTDESFQQTCANAIADGIIKYLQNP